MNKLNLRNTKDNLININFYQVNFDWGPLSYSDAWQCNLLHYANRAKNKARYDPVDRYASEHRPCI